MPPRTEFSHPTNFNTPLVSPLFIVQARLHLKVQTRPPPFLLYLVVFCRLVDHHNKYYPNLVSFSCTSLLPLLITPPITPIIYALGGVWSKASRVVFVVSGSGGGFSRECRQTITAIISHPQSGIAPWLWLLLLLAHIYTCISRSSPPPPN